MTHFNSYPFPATVRSHPLSFASILLACLSCTKSLNRTNPDNPILTTFLGKEKNKNKIKFTSCGSKCCFSFPSLFCPFSLFLVRHRFVKASYIFGAHRSIFLAVYFLK